MSPVAHPVGAGVPDGPYRRTLEYRRTLVYPSVGAGVPDGPHRRTFEYRRTLVYPSVGAGVPDGPFSVLRLRAAPASCICLRWPYFFQQRKKYGKERRQKPMVFGFPFRPIVTAVQKGSAPDRLHSYPRCRSCVPRENFLLSRRTEEVLYILHTFIFCGPKGRTYLSQSAGKRHPLPRPAFERPNGHTQPTRISSCLRSRTP